MQLFALFLGLSVFGDVIDIDWIILEGGYDPIVGDSLDIVVFTYAPYHNVWRFPNKEAFDGCDFDASLPLADVEESPFSYQLQTPGMYYFGCEVTGHCDLGQKVQVEAVGGGDVIDIDWIILEGGYDPIVGDSLDTVVFTYAPYHNVWRFPNKEAFDGCDFDASLPLADIEESPFSFQLQTPGMYYFGCEVTGHCDLGQKVQVEAAGDGDVIEISWTLPEDDYDPIAANPSDILVFSYAPFHNVWEFPNKAAFDECDFDNSDELAGREDSPFSYLLNAPGKYYFGCEITGHCDLEQRVQVTVAGEVVPRTFTSGSDSDDDSDSDGDSDNGSGLGHDTPTTEDISQETPNTGEYSTDPDSRPSGDSPRPGTSGSSDGPVSLGTSEIHSPKSDTLTEFSAGTESGDSDTTGDYMGQYVPTNSNQGTEDPTAPPTRVQSPSPPPSPGDGISTCDGDPLFSGDGPGCFYEDDIKFVSSCIGATYTEELEDCCDICENTASCIAWTWTKDGSDLGHCCLMDKWRPFAEISADHTSGYPRSTNNVHCDLDGNRCNEPSMECVEHNYFGICANDDGVCDCKYYFDCENIIRPDLFVNGVPNQCNCYAGAYDCPEREQCEQGEGFSEEPFCARTIPKIIVRTGESTPAAGPGKEFCHTVSRFVGRNNDQQLFIQRACDGRCTPVQFDAYCTAEPVENVAASIDLWFESFLVASQLPDGGYVDTELSQEARRATIDEDCSDFLGFMTMAVTGLCGGDNFVDHGRNHTEAGHNQESHWITHADDPCVYNSIEACKDIIKSGIEASHMSFDSAVQVDVSATLSRVVNRHCPSGFYPFGASGIAGDPFEGVKKRIEEMIILLSPSKETLANRHSIPIGSEISGDRNGLSGGGPSRSRTSSNLAGKQISGRQGPTGSNNEASSGESNGVGASDAVFDF